MKIDNYNMESLSYEKKDNDPIHIYKPDISESHYV